MMYTFSFDLYTFLYLPAKWIYLSKSRYLYIWYQEPENEKKPFYARKPIILPRRDPISFNIIKGKRHKVSVITITNSEQEGYKLMGVQAMKQRKKGLLVTGDSFCENHKRIRI